MSDVLVRAKYVGPNFGKAITIGSVSYGHLSYGQIVEIPERHVCIGLFQFVERVEKFEPCEYRGEEIGKRLCAGCKALRKEVPVYKCSNPAGHGMCARKAVLDEKGLTTDKEINVCFFCEYLPPNAS